MNPQNIATSRRIDIKIFTTQIPTADEQISNEVIKVGL